MHLSTEQNYLTNLPAAFAFSAHGTQMLGSGLHLLEQRPMGVGMGSVFAETARAKQLLYAVHTPLPCPGGDDAWVAENFPATANIIFSICPDSR